MKKFQLNLDALIVVAILFVVSIGGNIVLFKMYSEAARQNVNLHIKGQVDELNLASQKAYIEKLEGEIGSSKLD